MAKAPKKLGPLPQRPTNKHVPMPINQQSQRKRQNLPILKRRNQSGGGSRSSAGSRSNFPQFG